MNCWNLEAGATETRGWGPCWPTLLLIAGATGLLAALVVALDFDFRRTFGLEPRLFWLSTARATSAAILVFAAASVIWGPGRLITRLAVSISGLAATVMLWHILYDEERPLNTFTQHLTSLTTFLGALVLLAAAGQFGIGIVHRRGTVPQNRRQWQLSLLDLLTLMTAVAILLSLFRGFVPQELVEWSLTVDEIFWCLLHVGCSLLIVSTVVTCYHEPRAWWLNLSLAAAFAAAISLLHILALARSSGDPLLPFAPRLAARGVHHAVLLFWLLAGIGALQASGYHFRRRLAAADRLPADEERPLVVGP